MGGVTGAAPEVSPDTPEDAREMLRQSIENDKAELRDAVDDLKAAVKTRLTLRDNIAENPALWLLGALAVGVWLSRRDSRCD
jgi:hypothetical protein